MPRPLAVRRHDEIIRRLRAAGSVSVGELADTFAVSHETIRRDLKMLADQGHLDVVHGGASRRGVMEPALSQRQTENAARLQHARALIAAGRRREGRAEAKAVERDAAARRWVQLERDAAALAAD